MDRENDDSSSSDASDYSGDEVSSDGDDIEDLGSDEEGSSADEEEVLGLEESSSEEEEDIETQKSKPFNAKWGKKLDSYYMEGVEEEEEEIGDDLEESEIVKLNVEEARKIQKDQRSRQKKEDFEDIFDAEGVAEELDNEKSSDLAQIKKDFAGASKETKLEVLMRAAPELFDLIKEFRSSLAEVNSVLGPALQKATGAEDALIGDQTKVSKHGISFLDLKAQLLLQYCINISFYLLLKARGVSIKDHPVIKRLLEIRLFLEKIRPLDAQLRSQIDNIVKTGASLVDDAGTGETREAPAETPTGQSNPLSFKPQLSELIDENDEDENGDDGKYIPPKITPTHLAGVKSVETKEKRALRRIARGSLSRELKEELENKPLVRSATDIINEMPEESHIGQREEKIQDFEEEHFQRVSMKKADRKRKRLEPSRDLEDFTTSGDLEFLTEEVASSKRNLGELVNSIEQFEESARPRGVGDEDVPFKEPKAKNVRFELDEYEGDDISDLEEEEEEMVPTKRMKGKWNAKNAMYPEIEKPLAEGERRAATKDIVKNKAILKRYRKKEDKNPRVKLRRKYSKALKKKKSQNRGHVEAGGTYRGEAGSIKSNVIKSTSLK